MATEETTTSSVFKLSLESVEGGAVTLVQTGDDRPTETDWNGLHEQVRRLLQQDRLNWRFDLTDLTETNSTTLGLLVTLSATIQNREARSRFLVKKGSHLEKTMLLTKLDQIMNIESI